MLVVKVWRLVMRLKVRNEETIASGPRSGHRKVLLKSWDIFYRPRYQEFIRGGGWVCRANVQSKRVKELKTVE